MTSKKQIPASIAKEKLSSEIATAINQSCLPPFIIEMVMKDLYLEVKNISERQLETDKSAYDSCETSEDTME